MRPVAEAGVPEMLDRLLHRLVEPAGWGGGLALILLALVVTAEVAARAAGFALAGAAETSGVLLALLVFLVMAHTQRIRGHVEIEAVVTLLPPALRRWTDVLSLLVCLVFTAVLAVTTAQAAWDSYLAKEFQVGTLPFPIWPVRAVIALGFVLLALQLAVQLLDGIRRGPPPAAGDDPAGRGGVH